VVRVRKAGAIEGELGLAPAFMLLAASVSVSACEQARELPVTVLFPADTSDLLRANNASLVLRPNGDTYSFAVSGLQFSLELEGEPSTALQQLELYLAADDELLAWGSTPPFSTAGPDIGLAVFLGRPGALSSWPTALDSPDPKLLATEALARGMLMVEADGDTFLLNHYTLQIEAGARLPDTVGFAPDDGGLFSARDGSVIRLAWEQVVASAWRYDPGADRWTLLELDMAESIGLRPGAATLVDPDRSRIYVLGGGEATDAVAIDLVPTAAGVLQVALVEGITLDHPRVGATAIWIPTADNPTADALIIGGEQPGPLALRTSSGELVGPELGWRDLACALESSPPEGSEPASISCFGGLLDALPTADAAHFTIRAGEPIELTLSESFLPVALAEPLLFTDATALYAQGEGRWFRIERGSQTVEAPSSAAKRARGGHLVSLANGATFLVGGVDQDGVALERWQVFMPDLER